MDILIKPSSIYGNLIAPSSKSEMQRVVAAALLAKGESVITNPSFCEDSKVALKVSEKLGAKISIEKNRVIITGGLIHTSSELHFGESALALRMFAPIAGLTGKECILNGSKSLLKRPIELISESLSNFGIECFSTNNRLPISIKGKLKGNSAKIDGKISSQVLTGLLMALPCVSENSTIFVEQLNSKPYIKLTLAVFNRFGIEIESDSKLSRFKIKGNQKYIPQNYNIEGDWSNMSFMMVAAAIGGFVSIKGLNASSYQSDIQILKALESTEANIEWKNNVLEVSKNKLKEFEFDATDCPDLFPPLVALAAYCKGTSKIKGVSRLTHKESNRGMALKEEFAKLGIQIEIFDDLMLIVGGVVCGGSVDSHHDHRMAMALAIAALGANNEVIIQNAECVSKSYPDFFNDLKQLKQF